MEHREYEHFQKAHNSVFPNMSADNIRELFAQARQGDAAALEEVLALIRPRILAVIAKRIPDVAAREDITQDVMIKILRTLPLLEKEADPYAYFLTMARNATVDYIRKQARSLASENIDLLANELLDAQPTDFSVFNEIIDFITSMPTAPYRILVYLNNRFVYPARHGSDGRHRGFPTLIVDELGGLVLLRVTDLTFVGLREEFAQIEKMTTKQFYLRLEGQEKGVVFSEMILLDTLGERPAAIISMWTDRINRQVMEHLIKRTNHGQ